MTVFVVDTNVAIAANGRNTHADMSCQLACVEQLEHVVDPGVVAVDDTGWILEKYSNYLCWSGMPGVGDAFFKHMVNQLYGESRVRRVSVTPSDDDRKGFEELPENDFDRSDRKFLAVAVAAKAIVLNATDSDWEEHEELIDRLQVDVVELCPHEIHRKLDERSDLNVRRARRR